MDRRFGGWKSLTFVNLLWWDLFA